LIGNGGGGVNRGVGRGGGKREKRGGGGEERGEGKIRRGGK